MRPSPVLCLFRVRSAVRVLVAPGLVFTECIPICHISLPPFHSFSDYGAVRFDAPRMVLTIFVVLPAVSLNCISVFVLFVHNYAPFVL